MKSFYSFLFILISFVMFSQNDRYSAKFRADSIYHSRPKKALPNSVQTFSYAINPISYAPYADTGAIVLNNTDDLWEQKMPIGFTFNYFGNSYDTLVVGSNGQVTFDKSQAGAYNSWAIGYPLPNTSDMPANTICAAFRDIDPSQGGHIFQYCTGIAPNRALVISWSNIPLFNVSTACPGASLSNFQLVLYETSNVIEVYIGSSQSCGGWNSGYGIVGIQDASGTTAFVPPGRNFPTAWSATNEAWCFSPAGGAGCHGLRVNQHDAPEIKLFPNPSRGGVTVRCKDLIKEIIVTDLLGNVVDQRHPDAMEALLRFEEKGTYIISITTTSGKLKSKVFVD